MTEINDQDLREAVAAARSWRGVLRALGQPESSSARLRSIQRRARYLELPTSHFAGPRTWSDADLVAAVARGHSWSEVGDILGLAQRGNGSRAGVRRRAAELGLNTDHLEAGARASTQSHVPAPDADRLHRAGPMLAAAWFTMCGYDVLWPLEPCRYDLGVVRDGRLERVQVKTTTHRSVEGAHVAMLSNARRRGRVTYSPDELESFFVIDDELNCYLIPVALVAGRYQVYLRRYEACRVVTAGRLLEPASPRSA